MRSMICFEDAEEPDLLLEQVWEEIRDKVKSYRSLTTLIRLAVESTPIT